VKVLLNTRNSLAGHSARQALADVAGVSFSIEPNETVANGGT
jgi:hypothetical protein